jgi:D-amino peptidase
LQQAAVKALGNNETVLYEPAGPMHAIVKMRTGSSAAPKMANRWGLDCQEDRIVIDAVDIHDLYLHLIRICYLTPVLEKMLPFGLWMYHLWGRLGLAWVRQRFRLCGVMHLK